MSFRVGGGPGRALSEDLKGEEGGFEDDGRGRRRERGTPMEEDGEEGEGGGNDEEDVVVDDDGMAAMQAMMGFSGFSSTKGTKVAGNNAGGVYKAKRIEYRQYMNRVGGFNRPLSPSR